MEKIIRNCKMCDLYYCQEVGDSDYGAIYEDEPSCQDEHDMVDETGLIVEGFDRDCERECCRLSFFKVADIDKEIEKMFDEDMRNGEHIDRAYRKFKEKYFKEGTGN